MKTHTKIFIGALGTVAIVGGLAFAGTKVMAGPMGSMGGMGGNHRMEMMERLDGNSDGKITMAEIMAYREQLFAEHDKDGNKAISLSEFEGIWMTQMRPMMVDKFQMMDDDGDGQITDAEVDQKMSRMMRWMDKDDDGALSIREMSRGHKKYRGHRDHEYRGYRDHDDDDDHDRRYKDKS